MKRFFYLLSFALFFITGLAEARNAKVVEVQDKLKSDIELFVEKFAPNAKYSVKVKVIPLRRNSNFYSEENLPFMEFEQEHIQDEWDSNESNIYDLLSRIKEARVSLYIDDKIKIEDRSRFKDALLSEVNLIPGRDSVSIETISTPVMRETFNWRNYSEILLFGAILVLTVILGVGLNSLSSNLRSSVTSSNQEVKATPNNIPSQAIAGQSSTKLLGRDLGEIKGDLNIQDPTKINEVVSTKILKLTQSEFFPKLSDMVYLEELLMIDSSSFSYLIYEFPQNVQKSIYQKGKGDSWFRGFSDVGFPSKKVLITLDKMLRDRDLVHTQSFEELLIYSWRLGDELAPFIKSIEKDIAFTILRYLPKNISIPVARECFPGFWGALLQDQLEINIDDKLNKELIANLLRITPQFNYSSLQEFKNRKDLFRYLDSVEPHEERDVYSVMEESAQLEKIRPAFYRFFELEKEERRFIFEKYNLNEWAIACFNIERNEKEKIIEIMDDKERYMFGFGLKNIDENPSLALDKKDLRVRIAKEVYECLYRKNNEVLIEEKVEESYAA